MIEAIVYAAANQAMRIILSIAVGALVIGVAVGIYFKEAVVTEQIYKIQYGTAVHLVQAKNPAEAERHVFRPRTTRLTAVQARELERAGAVLEIAGEVAPLNQPQLPLGEQP